MCIRDRFYDKDREEIITSYQIVVLRFKNEEVIYNIEYVLSVIRDMIKNIRSLKKKK